MKQHSNVHGKADALFEHLIYSLATGRWQTGEKLPSVREAEKQWSVNRLTVLAAYRRLEAARLIESRGRSGYFVLGGRNLDDLSRYRYEIEDIYTKVLALLRKETTLLPSTVFKSLAEVSSFRVHQQPEVAFIECSHYQASYHSQEIEAQFQLPILPISLDAINIDAPVLQPSIRCLVTTGFHFHQVLPVAEKLDLPVVKVLIQIDEDKLRQLTQDYKFTKVFEWDDPIGTSIHDDVKNFLDDKAIDLYVGKDIESSLQEYLSESEQNLALLPPRIFGSINPKLRKRERVIPIDYKVSENQWQDLAKALKLSMSWFMGMDVNDG